jgi:hypothetical protein
MLTYAHQQAAARRRAALGEMETVSLMSKRMLTYADVC